jgi:hypothetical protein
MAGRRKSPKHGTYRADPNRQPKGGGNVPLRPPFQPGNDLGVTHGAKSTSHWLPPAQALAEELVTVAPWTARPAFTATVASWSKAEAQSQLLHAYLDDIGLLDEDGQPRPAVAMLDRTEIRAANLRQALGLTPLALAKLLQSLAAVAASNGDTGSLDAVRAEGRRIAEAHQELSS